VASARQLLDECFKKMTKGFGGGVALPSKTNECGQLERMSRHMLDDTANFHSPALVHGGRNISWHIFVKTVADHANRSG